MASFLIGIALPPWSVRRTTNNMELIVALTTADHHMPVMNYENAKTSSEAIDSFDFYDKSVWPT